MTSKYYKGKCTQCGVDLYDYDQNYSDGHMTLPGKEMNIHGRLRTHIAT